MCALDVTVASGIQLKISLEWHLRSGCPAKTISHATFLAPDQAKATNRLNHARRRYKARIAVGHSILPGVGILRPAWRFLRLVDDKHCILRSGPDHDAMFELLESGWAGPRPCHWTALRTWREKPVDRTGERSRSRRRGGWGYGARRAERARWRDIGRWSQRESWRVCRNISEGQCRTRRFGGDVRGRQSFSGCVTRRKREGRRWQQRPFGARGNSHCTDQLRRFGFGGGAPRADEERL